MDTIGLKRVRWIDLNGTRVLYLDFSNSTVQESLEISREFTVVAQTEPAGSILLLTNVTDAEYDPSIARQWKEARLAQDDRIRASAVYGLQGLTGIAIRGFVEARRLLGLSAANEPRIFADGNEAKNWLSEQ
jgi:hypothetical protein